MGMEIQVVLVMVMITYSAPADVTSTVHYRCPVKCTCTKMTSMASSNDALRLNCSGANYVTMPVMELAANRDEGGVTSGTWYDVILDNNRLYAIDYPRVIWMWVKSLSLRHNRLDYLLGHTFCASQKLVNLSLASNHIDIIRADAFRCLTSLRLLDLSENSLAEISPEWFVDLVSLTTLLLQANRLPTIYASSFSPLQSLTSLDLSANQLTHIYSNAFIGLSQLKRLNLSDNPLDSVNNAFGEFSHCDVIDISMTYFRSFDVTSCFAGVNVTMVIANRMPRLSLIDTGAFSNMPYTTDVQLENNPKLKYVDDQALNNVSMLHRLYLNNSALIALELSEEIMQLINNITLRVFLDGTPLRCDCLQQLTAILPPGSSSSLTVACELHQQKAEAANGSLIANATKCSPKIVPLSDAIYERVIGDSLELDCRSLPKHTVNWSFQPSQPAPSKLLPNSNSRVYNVSSLPDDVYTDGRGRLTIRFLLNSHQGIYTCYVTTGPGDAFDVTVRVRNVNAAIVILGSTATSVTVTWRAHMTSGGVPYVLTYRQDDVINATQRVIDIRSLTRSFTVSGLRSAVVYEFCVGIRRSPTTAVLPVSCQTVWTKGRDNAGSGVVSVQRVVLGGLVGGVIGTVALVCALSHLVRRYNRRVVLQEQLRSDRTSELYLAGVDALSTTDSTPVITYENAAAIGAYDDVISDEDEDEEDHGDVCYYSNRVRPIDNSGIDNDQDDNTALNSYDEFNCPQTSAL